MENTHRTDRTGPGAGAALLAFLVFALIAVLSVVAVQRRGETSDSGGRVGRIIQSADGSRLEMVTVMRRVQYRSDTTTFRSGDLVTIAGRGLLDLSEARMASRDAKLDVVVIGGRARVKVPPGWAVVTSDSLVLGGIRNQARRAEGDPVGTLRLDAVVLGGMLEVTH